MLKRFDWHLEAAVDAYFNGGMSAAAAPPRADANKIAELFETYKGAAQHAEARLRPLAPLAGLTLASCLRA